MRNVSTQTLSDAFPKQGYISCALLCCRQALGWFSTTEQLTKELADKPLGWEGAGMWERSELVAGREVLRHYPSNGAAIVPNNGVQSCVALQGYYDMLLHASIHVVHVDIVCRCSSAVWNTAHQSRRMA
jgi:hypothetical protein